MQKKYSKVHNLLCLGINDTGIAKHANERAGIWMKALLEVHDPERCTTITLGDEPIEFIEDIAEEIVLQLDRLDLAEDELDDEEDADNEDANDEFI